MFNRKYAVILALVLSQVLVLAGIFLNDIPTRDVASRYALMSEAFANGDWQYAFHPRIQLLQPVAGGIVAWIFHCNGFTALKIASALFFLAGILPVWKLFREIYGDKTSIVSGTVIFYLLLPYNIHMAYSGLRESAKTFILLLIAYGLVRIYRNIRLTSGYVVLGFGGALAVICRADMIMSGIFLLWIGMILECRATLFPRRSFISAGLTGVAVLGSSLINCSVSGHAMPDFRFARLFEQVMMHPGQFSDILIITVIAILIMAAGATIAALVLRKVHAAFFIAGMLLVMTATSIYTFYNADKPKLGEFIESCIYGNGKAIGIFSFLTVIYLVYRKRFSSEDFLLILVLLANMFFNIVPMEIFHKTLYVSDRYIFPAIPLAAGFFVIGIHELYQMFKEKLGEQRAHSVLVFACAAISIGFVIHAAQPTFKDYTRKKRIEMRNGIKTLKNSLCSDYNGKPHKRTVFSIERYMSTKAPFVLFDDTSKITVAAYLSGGSEVTYSVPNPDYFVGNLLPARFKGKAKLVTEVDFGNFSKKLWRIAR